MVAALAGCLTPCFLESKCAAEGGTRTPLGGRCSAAKQRADFRALWARSTSFAHALGMGRR
jgi:hypothetical protein